MDPSDSTRSDYQILIFALYVLIRTINIDRKSSASFHFSLMPPKPSTRPTFRGISHALLIVFLVHLTSCEKSNHSDGSETLHGALGANSAEGKQTSIVLPDDVVERAYRYLHRNAEEPVTLPPYKRGELLESMGGYNGPAGTVVYPVKFERFAVPLYFHQDEFGDWRFWAEKHGFRDSIAVPHAPSPEAHAEEMRQRQKKEQEIREAAEEERMVESARRQAEAEANSRKESERLRSEEEAEKVARKRTVEIAALDEEKVRRDQEQLASPYRHEAEKRMDQSEGEVKALRLAEAKAELAELESKIATERQRFQQATETINRLTNFKKTPVKEGSAAYRQCMDASRVIQEVEQKAPGMTTEKTRLATLVAELEK